MVCQRVTLPSGTAAIVCGPRQRKRKCVACGKPADLLCDWKVKAKRSGTCDAPICARCSHVPAPNKDLCPEHAAKWRSMRHYVANAPS